MLLSTLIPTLLHLLLALVSLLLYVTKTSAWYATLIEKSAERTSYRMKIATFMALPTAVIAMLLYYGVIYFPVKFFELG